MNEFIEILRAIAKRPAFYLCDSPLQATISQLRTFIIGVQVGRKCGEDIMALDVFDEWVLWRHGVPGYSSDWSGQILKRANGDEHAAFLLFFEYLEEYLVDRKQLGAEGIKAGLRTSYEESAP